MIEHIMTLSRDASAIIMQVYNGEKPLELNQKQDDSTVTAADLATHRVIAARLQALTSTNPLPSEGDWLDRCARQHWHRFWLVDLLGGTKEFLCRNGEFTVNIAVIEDGKPVIGVAYAQVTDHLYAPADGKVWRIDKNDERQVIEVKKCAHRWWW